MSIKKLVSLIIAFLILAGLVGGSGLGNAEASPAAQETPDAVLTDSFGYTLTLVDLPWIEANSGAQIPFTNMNNSMVKNLEIGFSFPFYEATFTQLNVSTNGFISFGVGDDSLFPTPLPWVVLPNNLVAPLWHNFIPEYNDVPAYLRAYIFTQGSAPSRRRVIEWEAYDRNPSTPGAVLILNYEVVLYEDTREILFQYNDLDDLNDPADLQPPVYTVGIEDADGINGLQHLPPVQVGQDIFFHRPPPGPRVKLLPRLQGSFAIDQKTQHRLRIVNNGEFGADRYNMTVVTSNPGWQLKFYDITGQQLLADTNSDAIVDTGLIAQGGAMTVTLKINAPAAALPGDYTKLTFTATSIQAPASWMTGTVQSAVPVQFSQIYVNGGDIRMSQIWKKNIIDRRTADYTGKTFSLEGITPDRYLAAWEFLETAPNFDSYTDIRFTIFDNVGGAGEEKLLTNGAQIVQDPEIVDATAQFPAIAPASGGRVAITWNLRKDKPLLPVGRTRNTNVYFAILDQFGVTLSELYDVTKQPNYYPETELHEYGNSRVAVTGDSRYVVCWIQKIPDHSVYCALHTFGPPINQTARPLVANATPTATLSGLNLAPLSNNRVLVTFVERLDPNPSQVLYAVLNSAGVLFPGRTVLAGATGSQPRAVQFTNGDVFLAWIDEAGQIAYAYLDSNLNLRAGYPQALPRVGGRAASELSLTLETDGKAVLTWVDGDAGDFMYYAVFDQNRVLRTPAMIFTTGLSGDFQTNFYGFGNASYKGIYQTTLPIIRR